MLLKSLHTIITKVSARIQEPMSIFYARLTTTSFPEFPSSKISINARLNAARHDIKKYNIKYNIGALVSETNPYIARVYSSFIKLNPNNLGNWSASKNEGGTKRLEYELIQKLIQLFHAQKGRIEGYATGGGTESNLYSVWIGKSYLLQFTQLEHICVVHTKLTHYSIDKACNICSLAQAIVPLDPTSWTMDAESLSLTMANCIRRGTRGFIISLTYGYTETGSSDNIEKILTSVTAIKKKYKGIYVSIIIDAAFNGLILPFISNEFRPFVHPDVHAFALDFSKFTAAPYPSGVVLYQKNLRLLIEHTVPVFAMKDNTITGSRPGASVAAMWAALHQHGKQTYKKIITNQLQLKQHFIKEIHRTFPYAETISDPIGLTCGVIFDTRKHLFLPKAIEKKYWLYAKKTQLVFRNQKKRTVVLYKFFFLQHVTNKIIASFFQDMKQ